MSQTNTTISTNRNWSAKRRYKVNEVVTISGINWLSVTVINTTPGVTSDWLKVNASITKTSQLTNDGSDTLNPFISKSDLAIQIMDGFTGVTAGFAVGQLTYTLPASGAKCKNVYLAHAKQYKITANNGSLVNRWSQSGDVVTLTKAPLLNNYIYIEYQL